DEQETESKQSMKNRYSPAVLSLANEYNINLTEIEGSGLGGRITRKDDKQHIKQIEGSSKDPLPTSHKTTETKQTEKGDIEITISNVRITISNNMVEAKH